MGLDEVDNDIHWCYYNTSNNLSVTENGKD